MVGLVNRRAQNGDMGIGWRSKRDELVKHLPAIYLGHVEIKEVEALPVCGVLEEVELEKNFLYRKRIRPVDDR